MKHTISVLVENHAGVLSRVSGLFSRRGFNIDSLAVGITDDPLISSITIVENGDEHEAAQLEKQLNNLIDTIKVKTLDESDQISRELALIKLSAKAAFRSEILTVCDIMGAKIIDISLSSITVEISETSENLQRFLELVSPYGIKEIVRTGVIAIQKGGECLRVQG